MATVYVAKTGNDSNDGSEGSPKLTIAGAFSTVSGDNGSTIIILDSGTYNEALNFNVGGGWGMDITVQGSEGETPVIDGTSVDGNGGVRAYAIDGAGESTTTLTGLKFINWGGTYGVLRSNSIYNSVFKVTSCTFEDNSSVNYTPRGVIGNRVVFNRCKLRGNDIFFSTVSGDPYVDVYNCDIVGTTDNTNIDLGGSTINGTVENCTVLMDVAQPGTRYAIRAGTINNCIVVNSHSGTSNLVGISAYGSRGNNCTFGDFGTDQTGGTDNGNNLTDTDPLFVDDTFSNPDLQLQSGSPCIDAGATISAITVDFLGVSRPQGSAYDIGAYEFVDTGPSFTPTDGEETYGVKFSSSFTIRGTANKLATRRFNSAKDNRQAPFSVTVSGPATIRRRTTPYKSET
jgi:hypothetical protein